MNRYQYFLSIATDEPSVGGDRKALGERLSRTADNRVEYQEEIRGLGRTTLVRLYQLIDQCTHVLHVIGEAPGCVPDDHELKNVLEYAESEGRPFAPPMVELFQRKEVTYTQYEAWFAIHLNRWLISFRLRDADKSPEQSIHTNRLKAWTGVFHEDVSSPTHLVLKLTSTVENCEKENPGFILQPIGLKAFGSEPFSYTDRLNFLASLPRDKDENPREKLPRSLRAAVQRILDSSFHIGRVVGSSGSGKSSWVALGLIPELKIHNFREIRVSARAGEGETETELATEIMDCLCRFDSTISNPHLELDQAIDLLTQCNQTKWLIVIDQFEQWIISTSYAAKHALCEALRKIATTSHIKVLFVYRSDYDEWCKKLLSDLGDDHRKEINRFEIAMFDEPHARNVLAAYGRGCKRAFVAGDPEATDEADMGTALLNPHAKFISYALGHLMDQVGRIAAVQLSLLTWMMREHVWVVETLTNRNAGQVVGFNAVGVHFLDDTFGDKNTKYAEDREAATRILMELAGIATGSDLKARRRGFSELRSLIDQTHYLGCGIAGDLDLDCRVALVLNKILCDELRLVSRYRSDDDAQCDEYELTHDYLVPAIRIWAGMRATQTGPQGKYSVKAVMRMDEYLELGINRAESDRPVPNEQDWIFIIDNLDQGVWTNPQRKLMSDATFRIEQQLCSKIDTATSVQEALEYFRSFDEYSRKSSAGDGSASTHAVLVDHLRDLIKLDDRGKTPPAPREVNSAAVLIEMSHPESAGLVSRILEVFYSVTPIRFDDFKLILNIISSKLSDADAKVLSEKNAEPQPEMASERDLRLRRLRILSLLAACDPGNPSWSNLWVHQTLNGLVELAPEEVVEWSVLFDNVREALVKAIATLYLDATRSETDRSLAISVLMATSKGFPKVIADFLMDADIRHFDDLFDLVADQQEAGDYLTKVLESLSHPDKSQGGDVILDDTAPSQQELNRLAKRRANAAIAQFRLRGMKSLHTPLMEDLLDHCWSDHVTHCDDWGADPSTRSFLIDRMGSLEVDLQPLRNLLAEDPSPLRRAAILAMGEYRLDRLAGYQEELLSTLRQIWGRNWEDGGSHSAAEWALMRLDAQSRDRNKSVMKKGVNAEWVKARRDEMAAAWLMNAPPRFGPQKSSSWFINSLSQTMIAIPGPVTFAMGAPAEEVPKETNSRHLRRIGRTFAISAQLVTWKQFRVFIREVLEPAVSGRTGDEAFLAWLPNVSREEYDKYKPDDEDCPVHFVSWHMAAMFCNWLSKREKLTPCYNIQTIFRSGDGGEQLPVKFEAQLLEGCVNQPNSGYRLPTEAEMEYVTRAGAKTSRCYGSTLELLGKYGWYGDNGGDGSWPVGLLKPNDLGFFDVHGNCYTWCVDHNLGYAEFGQSQSDLDPNSAVEDGHADWYGKVDKDVERIARGGTAHFDRPNDVRSAYRYERVPDSEKYFFSFRVAMTIAPTTASSTSS